MVESKQVFRGFTMFLFGSNLVPRAGEAAKVNRARNVLDEDVRRT